MQAVGINLVNSDKRGINETCYLMYEVKAGYNHYSCEIWTYIAQNSLRL
jgi:hypothetical protein